MHRAPLGRVDSIFATDWAGWMSAVGTSATFRGKGRMSGFSREADIRGLLSMLFYALRPSNEGS